MGTTFIDTSTCERVKPGSGQGEVAEIANRALCGAEDVTAMLRWLGEDERFEAAALTKTHQLIYLMQGAGVIRLGDKDYDVGQGAGVYLGPSERATIRHSGTARLKLLHLVVPIVDH